MSSIKHENSNADVVQMLVNSELTAQFDRRMQAEFRGRPAINDVICRAFASVHVPAALEPS
jgi:hypothetical protein